MATPSATVVLDLSHVGNLTSSATGNEDSTTPKTTILRWTVFKGFYNSATESRFQSWFMKKNLFQLRRALALLIFFSGIILMNRLVSGLDPSVSVIVTTVVTVCLLSTVLWSTYKKGFTKRRPIRLALIVALASINVLFGDYLTVNNRQEVFDFDSCINHEIYCDGLESAVQKGMIGSTSLVKATEELLFLVYWNSYFILGSYALLFCIILLNVCVSHTVVVSAFWYIGIHVTFYSQGNNAFSGESVKLFELYCVTAVISVLYQSYEMEKMWRSNFELYESLHRHNRTLSTQLERANRIIAFDAPTSEEQAAVAKVFALHANLSGCEIPFGDLDLRQRIGTGSAGDVILARYGDRTVAVKRLLRRQINQRNMLRMRDEIVLMVGLRHPNIVAFVGASWDNAANVCMVLEYMERGSVQDVLRDMTLNLTWDNPKLKLAVEVAMGMEYLHSRAVPIIHRDLKSANILVNSYFVCKVADFGLSRELDMDEAAMTVGTGSPLWVAPEVCMSSHYTVKADVFSYGIWLSELATHEMPYKGYVSNHPSITKHELISLVAGGKLRPEMSSDTPSDVVELAKWCWQTNPAARPSFGDVIDALANVAFREEPLPMDLRHLPRRSSSSSQGTMPLLASGDELSKSQSSKGSSKDVNSGSDSDGELNTDEETVLATSGRGTSAPTTPARLTRQVPHRYYGRRNISTSSHNDDDLDLEDLEGNQPRQHRHSRGASEHKQPREYSVVLPPPAMPLRIGDPESMSARRSLGSRPSRGSVSVVVRNPSRRLSRQSNDPMTPR